MATPDPEAVASLVRTERLPALLAQLCVNRGHSSSSEVKELLQPSLHALHDPSLLPSMDAAAERLQRAIRDGETILVHGDYDVDGVSGTALLVRFLRHVGGNAEWHIPHRLHDGYSFGDHSVRKAKEVGATLVISVDNGTSAHEPIAELQSAGIDVVVTDHHEPSEGELPAAFALVNPKLESSEYPFRELCGTAVGFKLAWAVAQRLSGAEKVRADLREFLLEALGYVAIATICDVVPLVGENRVLAHYGLRALESSPSAGVRALLERTGLAGRALTAEDIAFQIGPRINASGRLDSAARAVETLLADTPADGRALSERLETLNDQRRQVERAVLQEALEEVREFEDPERYPIIVVGRDGWHPGVVGIVASRLVDRFARPALVIGVDGGIGRGSARSVPGVSVLELMREGADVMNRFGGHEMAAGCEVDPDRIAELRDRLVAGALAATREVTGEATIDIDASIDLEQFDDAMMTQLMRLEPCGERNASPVLLAEDVRLDDMPRVIGQDRTHLMLHVRRGNRVFKAMAFGMASRERELQMGRPIDLAFQPRLNHWRGRTELQLVVTDFVVQ